MATRARGGGGGEPTLHRTTTEDKLLITACSQKRTLSHEADLCISCSVPYLVRKAGPNSLRPARAAAALCRQPAGLPIPTCVCVCVEKQCTAHVCGLGHVHTPAAARQDPAQRGRVTSYVAISRNFDSILFFTFTF